MNPKYPDITVRLVGEDGNPFAILGAVKEALKHGGVDLTEESLAHARQMVGSAQA